MAVFAALTSKTVILLLFTMLPRPGYTSSCPPPEDIIPCSCKSLNNSSSFYCGKVQTLEQLKSAISGMSGKSHRGLDFVLEDTKFEFLPHDLFASLAPVRHIQIRRCNLTRIGNLGEEQFKGLENSLESLTISNTFREANPLAYVSLQHLRKLATLDITDNHVEVIHNEWFKAGPASLTTVRFRRGAVRAVGYKALQSLPNLEVLDLSDNRITFFPRSVLPEKAVHLTELNLERNKLDSFPEDFFSGMPNLKTVNLELNDFSTIDEKMWAPVWQQLQHVNIDFNPLICDSKIKWLYTAEQNLEGKLVAMCYKPFILMERELYTLEAEELKSSLSYVTPRRRRVIRCFK